MHRSRSSIPYDILNGINFSANLSSMFAYLSYFPPPPPVIPSPPPRRSWTCSSRSSSSSSCLVSDDRNPPSLRSYIPLNDNNNNQSSLFPNTSDISKISHQTFKSSSISESISYFFQNQLTFILLLIIFLSIFVFVILLLLLFLYIQRHRQSQLTSNSHREINNNLELNNNNNNNNKNKKFYYHLIPYRQKHQRHTTIRNPIEENNSLRLTNHDSPVLEVIRLSKSSGIHRSNNEEQEEAL